jgi:hypothetical protein
MQSSGILCRLALVRNKVLEEHSASIIRVTRIGELGTLAVTSSRCTLQRNTISIVFLMMEVLCSSKTSALTRAIRHNFPEFLIQELFIIAKYATNKS